MNFKALFKYILDFNIFNIVFCVIAAGIFGLVWGFISFLSFGLLAGYLGFKIFKEQEYYAYYNLGFTKRKLLLSVFIFNCAFTPVLLVFYMLLKPMLSV